jgi:hypothetical protein
MNAREAPDTRQVGEDDAITTRIGAVALPLGVILFVVVTAIFHPFDSIPRLVAIILMALWAFSMAFVMWRNSSHGHIAWNESTAR